MKKILTLAIIGLSLQISGPTYAGFSFGAIDAVKKKVGELKEKKEKTYLPDLVITAIDAPIVGIMGDTVTVTYTVKNQGNLVASSFDVNLYLSSDSVITTEDTYLGQRHILGISAQASLNDSGSFTIPSLGTGSYCLGAICDPANLINESNENNNTNYDEMSIGQLTLGDDTKILGEQSMNEFLGQTGTTYYFGTQAAEIGALKEGDIIISKEGDGFLTKVISISNVGGQYVVEATNTTLEEAFKSVDVQFEKKITPDDLDSTQACWLKKGVSIQQVSPQDALGKFYIELDDVVLYDKDGDENTEDDQITANGEITFEPGIDFELKIDLFTLKRAKFVTNLKKTVELNLSSSLAELEADIIPKTTIGWFPLAPIPVGPIILVPEIAIVVGVSGEIELEITTGVTMEENIEAGLIYDNDIWSPVANYSTDFEWTPPTLSASGNIKGYIGPETSIKIYGIAGPYASIYGYLKLEGEWPLFPSQDLLEWKLKAGIEAGAGLKVEIMTTRFADYYKPDVITYGIVLAEGSIGPDLIVTNIDAPTSGMPESTITVSNAVKNQGLFPCNGFYARFYLSQDTTINMSDTYIGERYISGLGIGANSNDNTLLFIPQGITGLYYVGMIVDLSNAVNETDENNNIGYDQTPINIGGEENNPPYIPSDPLPVDGAVNQSIEVDLSWTGGDPDGDTVIYDVYFDTNNPPTTLVSNGQFSTTHNLGTLQNNIPYYWQIVATDSYGYTITSPVWWFMTGSQGGGNGDIVGTWLLYYVECDGIPDTVDYINRHTYNSTGFFSRTVIEDEYFYRADGTWQLQGNTLTITITAEGEDLDGEDMVPVDPPEIITCQANVSGDILTLTGIEEGETCISKWQRQ
jgi:hypothetical protein